MHLVELLGLDVKRLDDGGATVVLDADERHLNAAGTVHGGAIATLVDTAMGAAVFAGTDEDERPVTVEMKVGYLEPAQPGR
ncbi:MAG TPA: PaaI family thioesterase, partial [Acidimicrobiales bacterium]|nr:PaaI family thioesterase [Acidimicrobiales bacterium]